MIERIKEVSATTMPAKNYKDFSVKEKALILLEAHNDFENAYIWAGEMLIEERLETNSKYSPGNPVYACRFPFTRYDEVCIGTKVSARLRNDLDVRDTSTHYYYLNGDESVIEIEDGGQMLIGWRDTWHYVTDSEDEE